MSWADSYIKELFLGKEVSFRPKGNSMIPLIYSGQLCRITPIVDLPQIGDIVLCRVKGSVFLHLIKAIDSNGRFVIGNNKGHINGVASTIYGKVVEVSN